MFRLATRPFRILPSMIRTLVLSAALAVPVLAVPAMGGDQGGRIEAPTPTKMGAGFVLLMSLQR